MIQKQFVKSRQVCEVTFVIPKAELPQGLDIESLNVVGDFNDWDEAATPMKRTKKGVYKATIDMEPGTNSQFRYLANGEQWFNAWEADDYRPNDLGSDNCLVTALKE